MITGLIRDGRVDLDGTYVQARDAVLVPPARPDIPILVAAKRPRMFELTARHADAWNMAWFGLPDERLATGRRELAEACERVGRDPSTLTITVGLEVRYPDLGAGEAAVPGRAMEGGPEVIAEGLAAHAVARRGPRHRGARPQHAGRPGPVPRGRRRLPRRGGPAGLSPAQSSARFGDSQRAASSTDMPLRWA